MKVDARNLNDELFNATLRGDLFAVITALNDGADVNARNANGATPLMVAMVSDSDIVELLLKRGADVDARDNNGKTALSWACGNGARDAVKVLIGYGG